MTTDSIRLHKYPRISRPWAFAHDFQARLQDTDHRGASRTETHHRIGLAACQHRHRDVIAMQALGGKNMGLQQRKQRLQHKRARPDLIGQGRKAERHTPTRVTFGLAVQRLMLTELFEQDHRQQVRPTLRWHSIGFADGTLASFAQPRGAGLNGAGVWLIFSQSRQVNFSRTCWITFH